MISSFRVMFIFNITFHPHQENLTQSIILKSLELSMELTPNIIKLRTTLLWVHCFLRMLIFISCLGYPIHFRKGSFHLLLALYCECHLMRTRETHRNIWVCQFPFDTKIPPMIAQVLSVNGPRKQPHTCGPPTTKSPQGLMWKVVLSSKYLSGITILITLVITSARRSSRLIFSECWTETTTVCTRKGTQAPWDM
jgi:hypothetical protein